MSTRRHTLLLLFAAAATVALIALVYSRPQYLVQAVSGVDCLDDTLCTDDTARAEEARHLYEEALAFVGASLAPLKKKPLVVFCSTASCYGAFGSSGDTARSVGGFCVVIGPRGWKPYYVRHEFIHRLQWQELGVLQMIRKPTWFIEGMAYALSGDPRETLTEPFQGFRSAFNAWYMNVGKDQLWARAREL